MRIKTHCEDCKKLLGSEFLHVHKFLDQYAEIFDVAIFTEYHRSFLHNRAGLAAIMSKWGQKSCLAGMIHMSRDYHEDLMDDKDMEWIINHWSKVNKYFSDMTNFDPQLDPRVMAGWKGKSLCWIAFENNGLDEYYRHLRDL